MPKEESPPQMVKTEKVQRFTGFKDSTKKKSSGKKRRGRGGEAGSLVPMIFFDEDENGNVVEREMP